MSYLTQVSGTNLRSAARLRTVLGIYGVLDGETLRDRLQKQPRRRLTESQSIGFTWQLATALSSWRKTQADRNRDPVPAMSCL